jgi:CRISPR/Cas system-associated endonuclease/helicase Cas3
MAKSRGSKSAPSLQDMLDNLLRLDIIAVKGGEKMYLTVKQQLKHLSKTEYRNLRRLCHTAKSLMNQAIYLNRQYYFSEKKYLGYVKTYHELKTSDNYKILNSNMAQQSLKVVDGSFKHSSRC